MGNSRQIREGENANVLNVEIVNNPDSRFSFHGPQVEGWIEVLLVRICAMHITDWKISEVESFSDHRVMTWTYLGRPASRIPRDANRRWWQSDLIWDEFLRNLQTADLTSYEFATPDDGVEHLTSTLIWLCSKNKKLR